MKTFLAMKAWQLFLLLVGPYFLMIVMIGGDPGSMFTVMPFAMLIFIAAYLVWFWSLGNNINRKVPIGVWFIQPRVNHLFQNDTGLTDT